MSRFKQADKYAPGRLPRICLLTVLTAIGVTGFAGCGQKTVKTQANYAEADSVSITLDDAVRENGLQLVQETKSRIYIAKTGGRKGQVFKRSGTNDGHVYFRIDPSFKRQGLTNVSIAIEFLDSRYGSFEIEYDGFDGDTPDRSEKGQLALMVYQHGEYTPCDEKVSFLGTLQWKTAIFPLKGACFENRQDYNADFRLTVAAPEITLRQLTVRKE